MEPAPVAHVSGPSDMHGPELPWPQVRHGAFTPPHDMGNAGWQEVHNAQDLVEDERHVAW